MNLASAAVHASSSAQTSEVADFTHEMYSVGIDRDTNFFMQRIIDLSASSDHPTAMLRIFICHSADATEFVESVLMPILPPASNWCRTASDDSPMSPEEIDILEKSDVLIALDSPIAGSVKWIAEALQIAQRLKKPIILITTTRERGSITCTSPAAEALSGTDTSLADKIQACMRQIASTRNSAFTIIRHLGGGACAKVFISSTTSEMQEERRKLLELLSSKPDLFSWLPSEIELSRHRDALQAKLAAAAQFMRLFPTHDQVEFSAFCPSHIQTNNDFVLQVIAHLKGHRETAKALANRISLVRDAGWKSSISIQRGSGIVISVQFPKLRVRHPTVTIEWNGEIGNAEFLISVPPRVKSGKIIGHAQVVISGVVRALFSIELNIVRQEAERPPLEEISPRNVRTAFASYSSSDRIEALRFKQYAESVGVDVFVDVSNLRSGDDWQERLRSEIKKRDLFCLFWSRKASKSTWVRREWRLALETHGCQSIQPIPLADPRDVPPPKALRNCLHFDSLLRIAAEYENFWRQKPIID